MYGKLFESLYEGSMVGAGLHVFGVWTYVIAKTKCEKVELNPKVIAFVLGCTEEEVKAAIEYLCAPDPDSRNKEYEGRRLIREGQFQYFVTGAAKHRGFANEDNRRAYNANKQTEYRHRKEQQEKGEGTDRGQAKVPEKHEPSKSQEKSQLEQMFAEFWEAYPKRVAKAAAKKVFVRLKPTRDLLNTMLDAISDQEKGEQWARDGGKFIPYAATWLNQQRWEDEAGIETDDDFGENLTQEELTNLCYNVGEITLEERDRRLKEFKETGKITYREEGLLHPEPWTPAKAFAPSSPS